MEARRSSRVIRFVTATVVVGACAIVPQAAFAAPSATACARHPELAGCTARTSEPAATATDDEPPEQPPATAEQQQPAAAPPAAEPEAIEDPPTIVTGTAPDPAATVDECRNMDGVQADVPEGHYIDAYGNCVEPADQAAGDGVDDDTEETVRPSGGTSAGGQGAGGAAGAQGGGSAAGGAGSGAGTGSSAASHDGTAGRPTAVLGVADAPTTGNPHDTGLGDGAGDGLPFTGVTLVPVGVAGLLAFAAGVLLRRSRRPSPAAGAASSR